MAQGFQAEKIPKQSNGVDVILLASILLLLGTGLSMLFSASYYRADFLFNDPYHFIRSQSMYAALGVLAGLAVLAIPMNLLTRLIPPMIFLSIALMLLTFIPGVGVEYLGARRWIQLAGYTFQPAELVKLTLIVYLAYILGKKQDRLEDVVNSLLPPFIIVLLFVALIYLQNDFSSAMFLGFIGLTMFYIAGVRMRHFIALGFIVVPLGVILLLSREHRVIRLISFLEPEKDPSGAGYQVLASLSALRNGGFWGMGIGQGIRKLGGLPEAQSDFVFAVLGEELGFLGVSGVIVLFGLLAWRGYRIAVAQENPMYALLAYGITSALVLQAGVNMAVVSGMIPATGIPMPFFASGGSYLLITMILSGLLLKLSMQRSSTEEDGAEPREQAYG
ncbi:putative lipid II flippase FtsW [Salinispira pacifica]|uniref:Probable peptidoglycan glycosyltransferase FtsW n=1 Tax=Salinispira pacifica TaxID=1307761 RepID=V5WFI3_9SPIO|nr:putative lipid II flippase FtsW [Salinispira pacifica]AHC14562.1 Cell division protein FtsW [Salinispira pacifica]